MEDIMNLRAGVARGVVQSIDDSGQVQTATVQTHDGVVRTVEVWQLDGFGSVPDADGAIALLFASGNDPSQFIALLANPSTRFGKQLNGERVVSMPDGTRVALRQGGIVEIWGGNQVIVNSPTVVVTASGSVTVTTPTMTVNGDLHVTGAVIGGYGGADQVGLQTHSHMQSADSHGDSETPTDAPTANT